MLAPRPALKLIALWALILAVAACGKDESKPGTFSYSDSDVTVDQMKDRPSPARFQSTPPDTTVTTGDQSTPKKTEEVAAQKPGGEEPRELVTAPVDPSTIAPVEQELTPAETKSQPETKSESETESAAATATDSDSASASVSDPLSKIQALPMAPSPLRKTPAFNYEFDPEQEVRITPLSEIVDGQEGTWTLRTMDVWTQVEEIDQKKVVQMWGTAYGMKYSTGSDAVGVIRSDRSKILMHTTPPATGEIHETPANQFGMSLRTNAAIPLSFSRKDGSSRLTQKVVFEAVKGQVKSAVFLVENPLQAAQFLRMDEKPVAEQSGYTERRYHIDYLGELRVRSRSVKILNGKLKVTTITRASYKSVNR